MISLTDQLLDSITSTLKSQPQVTAAWLAGSRGRNSSDEFSDIDIWVAIDDESIASVIHDPLAYVHGIIPTVMHVVAPSIAPAGGTFIGTWVPIDGVFVQVDWYFTSAEGARRDLQTKIIFGDVPIADGAPLQRLDREYILGKANDNLVLALQMINNLIKHARRGNTWRMADHARHADNCLSMADYLLRTDMEPDFHSPRKSFLPNMFPACQRDIRAMADALIETVEEIAEAADMADELAAAVEAVRETISRW